MQVFKVNQPHLNEEAILIFPNDINWKKDTEVYLIANTKNIDYTYIALFERIAHTEIHLFDDVNFIRELHRPHPSILGDESKLKAAPGKIGPRLSKFELENRRTHSTSMSIYFLILKGQYPNIIEIRDNKSHLKIIEEINAEQLLTHENPFVRNLTKELI